MEAPTRDAGLDLFASLPTKRHPDSITEVSGRTDMSHTRSGERFYLAGVVVAAGWATAAIVAIAWGTLLDWPDFVHTNYGFPFTFATHTTSTLVGAVDDWSLDLAALESDIVFWIAGTILIFVLFIYLARRASRSNPTP
jgi:hypothetical protein